VKARNHEKDRRRRWWCNGCDRSFSVTVNTILHGTHLPLQKWFLAVIILVNAKKSVSSHQLSRDLDIPVKTAYSLSQRIRKGMLGATMPLLQGIVEMDETYVGGKPRYKGESKPGRGTKKTPVIGAVEREGNVIAEPIVHSKVNTAEIRKFLLRFVDGQRTHLISDEFSGYLGVGPFVQAHDTINHSETYVDGDVHTNSIESFWALVKRAHYGQHHHYSKEYMHLYIGEACFKYNNRKQIKRGSAGMVFDNLLSTMLSRRS